MKILQSLLTENGILLNEIVLLLLLLLFISRWFELYFSNFNLLKISQNGFCVHTDFYYLFTLYVTNIKLLNFRKNKFAFSPSFALSCKFFGESTTPET